MGTVSDFNQHWKRRQAAHAEGIRVSAFGFSLGERFVPWQAVSAIHLHREPEDVRAGCLYFDSGGERVGVWMCQAGFAELERAMTAIFPATADWRARLSSADTCGWITLHASLGPPRG